MARAKHLDVRAQQQFTKLVRDTERQARHNEMLTEHKARKKKKK